MIEKLHLYDKDSLSISKYILIHWDKVNILELIHNQKFYFIDYYNWHQQWESKRRNQW